MSLIATHDATEIANSDEWWSAATSLPPEAIAYVGVEIGDLLDGAMIYDRRRLRLHGVIRRVPHTLRYTLTADGVRAAFLCTTLYRRLRRPHTATRIPPLQLPSSLDAALHHLDPTLQELWTSVKLAA
jgi:hypothetical protein